MARVEYDRLLRDARERKSDHLVVWAPGRFSRDETSTRATQAILDLEANGVLFHSAKEPSLETPEDGRLNIGRAVLLALLPAISSFGSKRRDERVRMAMAELQSGRRSPRSGLPPAGSAGSSPAKPRRWPPSARSGSPSRSSPNGSGSQLGRAGARLKCSEGGELSTRAGGVHNPLC